MIYKIGQTAFLIKTTHMKRIMFLAIAFVLGTTVVSAQQKMDKMDQKMDHKMKDCIMMKDGKMMVEKGGSTMEMKEDMTLSNGTMVMKDGSVKTKDGKMMKMKDGDCIYMNGKMKKMSAKMDKKL
jgi:hypothetical protein